MTDFLVRRIARQPRGVLARVALGLGVAALAVAIRLALSPYIGPGAPFGAFLLAVLAASVFGGAVAGATCAAALVAGGLAMLAGTAHPVADRRAALGALLFVASSGFVVWIVNLLREALAREVAAREGERLLKLELHHRVKNTLSIVQSLADQTFRANPDGEAARRDFTERLAALAGAHDLLVDTGWRAVTVEALAAKALAPFRPAADLAGSPRVTLAGAAVTVAPEAAVALALCLHELATNAVKYGALSGPAGRVELTWRVDEAGGRRRLELDWRETGGPAPAPGERMGFGARLLTRALSAQPGATATLSFPPEGARWTAGFEL